MIFAAEKKTEVLTSLLILGLGLMNCTPTNYHIDRSKLPQIESAAFYGPDNAWLVTWEGRLLRTSDGGATWETIQDVDGLEAIAFIDQWRGWASTVNRQVLRTTDGGVTWVSIAKLGDDKYGPGLGHIKFIDEKHGWIVQPLLFWLTEDGGITWQQYASPGAHPKSVFDCFFIDPQVGWLSGAGGALYRTQDGGKTWQEQNVLSDDKDLVAVSFVDDVTGWVAATPNDGIYRTQDGGKTWSFLPDPGKVFYLRSIQFTSRSEGWAGGTDTESSEPSKQKPLVLHTTNGGQHWERVRVAEDEPFVHHVHFTDSEHGWLLSRDNVYRTDDGGKNWRVILALPPVVKN